MNNKENTRKAHNAIAKQYHELYNDDTSDLKYIDRFLNKCGKNILDLGCGMGQYSRYMNSKGYNITGIDISEEMLNIANDYNSPIEYILGDICNLEMLDSKKYNGILIAYVLQHLSKTEVKELFSIIPHHLEHNSYILLFIREGNAVLEEEEPINPIFKYEINEYTKEEISLVLKENGFDIITLEEKEYVEDPNSLSPNTLVILAKIK